jgi:hypothetical protein
MFLTYFTMNLLIDYYLYIALEERISSIIAIKDFLGQFLMLWEQIWLNRLLHWKSFQGHYMQQCIVNSGYNKVYSCVFFILESWSFSLGGSHVSTVPSSTIWKMVIKTSGYMFKKDGSCGWILQITKFFSTIVLFWCPEIVNFSWTDWNVWL